MEVKDLEAMSEEERIAFIEAMSEEEREQFFLGLFNQGLEDDDELRTEIQEAVEKGRIERIRKKVREFFDKGWPGMMWDGIIAPILRALGAPV